MLCPRAVRARIHYTGIAVCLREDRGQTLTSCGLLAGATSCSYSPHAYLLFHILVLPGPDVLVTPVHRAYTMGCKKHSI
eukprot:1889134-Amphidinium_carterae.2